MIKLGGLGTSVHPRKMLTFGLYTAAGTSLIIIDHFPQGVLSLSFGYNLGQVMFEPMFVSKNDIVTRMSQKYSFTVFDFALAKKES
jgi:hypothetical protein